MAEEARDVVAWLRTEVDKRLNPWQGTDRKGNPETKEPLQIAITIMPMDAMQLLRLAELGQKQEKGNAED